MEENLNQNIVSSTEPVVVTPILSTNQPPFGSWWKVGGLVLGAVILAGGLFFAGYQYSQKQPKLTTSPTISPTPTPIADPTANWKSYNNQRYGYSIKYPPTFNIFENPPNKRPESLDFVIFKEGKLADILVPFFTIEVSQVSLEKAVAYGKWTIEGHVTATLVSERSTSIGGQPGIILIYRMEDAQENEYGPIIAVVQRGSYSYTLRTSNSPQISFDQILSTFQFLN